MIKKIGFHTGDGWFKHLSTIEKWQPPVVTVLSPNPDEVKQLKKVSPNTIVIGRIYVEDGWANEFLMRDPKGFAQYTDQRIRETNISEVEYWVLCNEPTPYWNWMPKINEYNLELMKLGDANGYKVGIVSVSVGNFDLPPHQPMVYWEQLAACLKYAQEHKHLLLVHQYQKPNLLNNDDGDSWLILRLEKRVLAGLREMGLTDLKVVISEIGVDHLINGGQIGGFQKSLNDQQYFDQLLQWEKIEQDYPQIIGGCIFMFGSQNPWQSYSITENSKVAEMLGNHYHDSNNYDGNIPESEGETIFMPSIKKDVPPTTDIPAGVDWDENLTKRGVVLTPYQAKEGESYWKCIKGEYLTEKEHIFVNTLDEKGKQKPGVTVIFYWQDGQIEVKTKDITNDKYAYGMADFAMHAHSNSYGVHIEGPSDDIWGMGLGSVEQPNWNIHVSYRFTFQLVKAKKVKPPKPTTPTEPEKPTQPPQKPIDNTFVPFKGRVLASVLNVRSAPEMGDNIVNKLGNGAVVDVIEHTSNGWYKIGDKQYVADQFVEKYGEEHQVVDSLLQNFARIYKIDPDVIKATFAVESGNKAFGPFGKPIMRFENHIFDRQLKNPEVFNKYFKYGQQSNDQWFRPDENSEWTQFHGDQKKEWQVFEFAKKLNQDAAENSASFGMPQIMGFNHAKVGYPTAGRMIEAFSEQNLSGIISQVSAFFAYVVNTPGAIEALQNKDFEQFALLYNGSRDYTPLLQNAYNEIKGTS